VIKTLTKIDLDGFSVFLDPESVFWATSQSELPNEAKELWIENREKLQQEIAHYRSEVSIKTVYLNVTDSCNASCPYCYIPPEVKRRGQTMSYEQISEILDVLKKVGVEWIIFHGAEPLLAKDVIFRAIEENRHLNYGIQTNGFLLNDEDMEFIMEREVNLGISFDSPDEKTNDFLRGEGHFNAVSRILEVMRGYKHLNVITTINHYNYTQLPEMVDFLAGKVEVCLMNPVRDTSAGGRKLRPPVDAAAEYFIKAVDRAIELTESGERIVIGDFANILLGIVAPTSRVLQCDISPCGAGRRFFAITPDMKVYPCGEFIGFHEFSAELSEVLDGGKINTDVRPFKKVRDRVVEKIEECRICPYRHICGAPCPAEVYAEKGSMFEKSPYCDFYRKVIDHAFRVIAEGKVKYVIREEVMRAKYRIEL